MIFFAIANQFLELISLLRSFLRYDFFGDAISPFDLLLIIVCVKLKSFRFVTIRSSISLERQVLFQADPLNSTLSIVQPIHTDITVNLLASYFGILPQGSYRCVRINMTHRDSCNMNYKSRGFSRERVYEITAQTVKTIFFKTATKREREREQQ